jgi:hypothetical protein
MGKRTTDNQPLSLPDRAGSPRGRVAATTRPFIEAAYASCLIPLRWSNSEIRRWEPTIKRLYQLAQNVSEGEYSRKARWLVAFITAFNEIRSQPFRDIQKAQALFGYGIPTSTKAVAEIEMAIEMNLIRRCRGELLVNEAADEKTIREHTQPVPPWPWRGEKQVSLSRIVKYLRNVPYEIPAKTAQNWFKGFDGKVPGQRGSVSFPITKVQFIAVMNKRYPTYSRRNKRA